MRVSQYHGILPNLFTRISARMDFQILVKPLFLMWQFTGYFIFKFISSIYICGKCSKYVEKRKRKTQSVPTVSILCLIMRTTVTSLRAPKDTRCKRHHPSVNPGVPFWMREKTHKLRARWQESSFRIRADVTVVLEVRQSIVNHWLITYTINNLPTCLSHLMKYAFSFVLQ